MDAQHDPNQSVFEDPEDGTYNFVRRNDVVIDETDYRDTSRAEVQIDESAYRGTTRAVTHTDNPPVADRD